MPISESSLLWSLDLSQCCATITKREKKHFKKLLHKKNAVLTQSNLSTSILGLVRVHAPNVRKIEEKGK